MYLQSLASAFPEARYTQRECWKIAKESPFLGQLSPRSAKILETVLSGSSGIETRHFAVPTEKLFSADAEELNKAFEQLAPPLAATALQSACDMAKVNVRSIDAVFVAPGRGNCVPGV